MVSSSPRTLWTRSLFAALILAAPVSASLGDIYVDDDAAIGGDGVGWATAYADLQDALLSSFPNDVIHVAGGTYYPDRSELFGDADGDGVGQILPGDRTASFVVPHNLTIQGGLAGLWGNPTNPDEYDDEAYPTIFSGDLEKNDGGLNNPQFMDEFDVLRVDNSIHVLTVLAEQAETVLSMQGVTVQSGFGFEEPGGDISTSIGAGIYCPFGEVESITYLKDCRVRGNYAAYYGGGIYNERNIIEIRDSEIVGNASRSGAGYFQEFSPANNNPGYLFCDRVLFMKNMTRSWGQGSNGGAICLFGGLARLYDCVLVENSVVSSEGPGKGGAIYLGYECSLQAFNNTFKENYGNDGVGGATLYCEKRVFQLEFANNICWGAVPVVDHMVYPPDPCAECQVHFGYNDIEGLLVPFGVVPGNDVDVDPDFEDYFGRLDETSPCIDAAWNQAVPQPNDTDFDSNERIVDDPETADTGVGGGTGFGGLAQPGVPPIVDMGAFEFWPDCQPNGIPDATDIANGTSDDCNGNGYPDECEWKDCNGNNVLDICDIANGTSQDANGDDVPDECDCNDNGTPDNEDIANGVSEDENGDGMPDECDCNDNGVDDDDDIARGTSDDDNGDGMPDECDCNDNGVEDEDDIASGFSDDDNGDGLPDECDCNGNGIDDEEDIASGTSDDDNGDGFPDECDCNDNGVDDDEDIASGLSSDRNGDGLPDECDCNNNGVDDNEELASGAPDTNGDGLLDECDCDLNGHDDEGEINNNPSLDQNGDGLLDRCDCNDNGVDDDDEIANGALDSDGDGLLDECDCDGDGVDDSNEIEGDPTLDDNNDGVLDECDCNRDGVFDSVEIAGGAPDSNGDGLLDECDCDGDGDNDDDEIADDPTLDENNDGVLDECDCNRDGVVDSVEIAGGAPDSNGDGLLDECDCDSDGIPDDVQIDNNPGLDGNNDGVLDQCDCNKNGIVDSVEIAGGVPDSNGDGLLDECDCDGNGLIDDEEMAVDASLDENNDGVLDECDCNDNGIKDDVEIAGGAPDSNGDGLMDECDCDGNGEEDDDEIALDPALDNNADGLLDRCDCNDNGINDADEIAANPDLDDTPMDGLLDKCDCNENGIDDDDEIAANPAIDQFPEPGGDGLIDACDCNQNGVDDGEDIENGTSEDCNNNGVPDECPDCEDENNNGVPDCCEIPCVEFDRTRLLTGRDTITLITNEDNPELDAGYVYVHALGRDSESLSFDHLIGQELIVDGIESFEYAINAVDFRAGVKIKQDTDLDGDGILDLNGSEYEMAPNELLVPRFWGQTAAGDATTGVSSELILIGLSGGSRFQTVVDFMVYNDNEEEFSTEHTFECWERVSLNSISGVFTTDFLRDLTNHDPGEVYGAPHLEAGWFRMFGRVANSSGGQVTHPAIYGVLVERAGQVGVADLPFETGGRAGHLLPGHLQGDNEEWDGENLVDPSAYINRRRPGSLLLYPLFDNRDGVVSLITVTNTSREDVNVHFKYIGRWKQF